MNFYSNYVPIPGAKQAYRIFETTLCIREALLAIAPYINRPIQGKNIPIKWCEKTGEPVDFDFQEYDAWDGKMSRVDVPVTRLIFEKIKPEAVLLLKTKDLTVGVIHIQRPHCVPELLFFIPTEVE